MSEEPRPLFFTFKPNLLGGRLFFYFGPWDRMPEIREWYLSHGTSDTLDRIKDHAKNGMPDAERYDGQVLDPCPGFPLLMMQETPHTPKQIGVLTHEIHHLVQRWTEALGVFTSRESEEIFAYAEGLIAEIVLDYIWHGTVAPGLEPP